MEVKWKNGNEREKGKSEKAIWIERGRISGGGSTAEWSRLCRNVGNKLPLLNGYVHLLLLQTF